MIISNLNDYKNAHIPPLFQIAISEAMQLIKNGIPENGIYPLSEKTNNSQVIIMTYMTKTFASAQYETHDIMADVQMCLKGEEYFLVRNSDDLTSCNQGDDITFYKEKPREHAKIHLIQGNFAIIFPKEAHMPSVAINDVQSQVTKLVIKVPVGK